MNACKHGNGRDWGILAQRFNDSLFYKILITPDTILVFMQQTGTAVLYFGTGQSVFSPDGSKYVMLTQNHVLDVFSDTILGYLGASISPNNKYLYINSQFLIYQLDLTSSLIDTTLQIVAVYDSFAAPTATLFQHQTLGLDGKIYIGTFGGTFVIHTIEHPIALARVVMLFNTI